MDYWENGTSNGEVSEMIKKKPHKGKKAARKQVVIHLGKAGKIDPRLLRQAIVDVKKAKQ